MNVFEQMLASYEVNDREDKLNAIHEVMQQVTLAALGQGDFLKRPLFTAELACGYFTDFLAFRKA